MASKTLDIDSIIERLLGVRGSRPGKQVQVSVCWLRAAALLRRTARRRWQQRGLARTHKKKTANEKN